MTISVQAGQVPLGRLQEVVALLATFHTVENTAARMGLPVHVVQEIGTRYGYPNTDRLAVSADRLALEVDKHGRDARPAPGSSGFEMFTRPRPRPSAPPAVPGSAPARSLDRIAASLPGEAGVQLLAVPPEHLTPDPSNPRDRATMMVDIDSLADSIRTNGLLQPIVARRTGDRIDPEHPLMVVAGHRRLLAVKRLGWKSVPVVIRQAMSGDEALAAMLVENSHRRDLDPVQEARAIRHLMGRSEGRLTHEMVARKLGRNQVWVSTRLALLELPVEDQAKIRSGDMTIGEGVRRSRADSGRSRGSRSSSKMYLDNSHDLAARARNRCTTNGHLRGSRIGAVACGQCWEAVIRADERSFIHEVAVRQGTCPTCDRPMP